MQGWRDSELEMVWMGMRFSQCRRNGLRCRGRRLQCRWRPRIIWLISVSPPGPSIHDELLNLKDDNTKDHLSITFAGIYGRLSNLGYNDVTQQLQSTIRADLPDEWLNLRGKDAMPWGIALVEKWLNSNGDDVTQQLPAFDNEWLNIDYDNVTQQQSAICRDEADQLPLVGDKGHYKSSSSNLKSEPG